MTKERLKELRRHAENSTRWHATVLLDSAGYWSEDMTAKELLWLIGIAEKRMKSRWGSVNHAFPAETC